MKRLLLALLALPLSLLADGGLPNQPYIYVEGKAEIERPADFVTLRFDLVASHPEQAKANQEIQGKATKILASLDERKIASDDVVATDLKSEPQFENDEDPPRKRGKLIGYKVTRSFMVNVRNVTLFPKLVDELLGIGGVEFSGIDTALTKGKEVEDEIWNKALADARQRASKTVAAAGMKIDSVFAISPTVITEIEKTIFGSSERTVVTGSNIAAPRDLLDPSKYRLAPITVHQSVHVIYLISPAK